MAAKRRSMPKGEVLMAKPVPDPQEHWSQRTKMVHTCIRMMLTGQWDGESTTEIANLYSIAHDTMRKIVGEASRFIQISADIDTIEQLARARLIEIAHQDGPDRVPAIKVLLDSLEKRGATMLQPSDSQIAEAKRLIARSGWTPPKGEQT